MGGLQFAGMAFLTLTGDARSELQERMAKLATNRTPVKQRTWRKPQWVKPTIRVRVRHLAGGDTLRHATLQAEITVEASTADEARKQIASDLDVDPGAYDDDLESGEPA